MSCNVASVKVYRKKDFVTVTLLDGEGRNLGRFNMPTFIASTLVTGLQAVLNGQHIYWEYKEGDPQ